MHKKRNKKQKKHTKTAETTGAEKRPTQATKIATCKKRAKNHKNKEKEQGKRKPARYCIGNA